METQRVLIVDDERNIRLTLKGALEAIGLEVDAVFQGEEALQKLTEKTYDRHDPGFAPAGHGRSGRPASGGRTVCRD